MTDFDLEAEEAFFMLQQQQFIALEEEQAAVLQRSLTDNSPGEEGGGVVPPSATAPPTAAVPPSKVVHMDPTMTLDDDGGYDSPYRDDSPCWGFDDEDEEEDANMDDEGPGVTDSPDSATLSPDSDFESQLRVCKRQLDTGTQLGGLGESLEQKSQDSCFTEEQRAEFLSLYKQVRTCQFPQDLRRLKGHLEAGELIELELGMYRLQRDLYFLGTDSKDQLASLRQDLENTRVELRIERMLSHLRQGRLSKINSDLQEQKESVGLLTPVQGMTLYNLETLMALEHLDRTERATTLGLTKDPLKIEREECLSHLRDLKAAAPPGSTRAEATPALLALHTALQLELTALECRTEFQWPEASDHFHRALLAYRQYDTDTTSASEPVFTCHPDVMEQRRTNCLRLMVTTHMLNVWPTAGFKEETVEKILSDGKDKKTAASIVPLFDIWKRHHIYTFTQAAKKANRTLPTEANRQDLFLLEMVPLMAKVVRRRAEWNHKLEAKRPVSRRLDPCVMCTPELRDPMTHVLAFLANPSPLRVSCQFFAMCFQHAIYLEVPLSCHLWKFTDATRGVRLKEEGGEGESFRVIPISPRNPAHLRRMKAQAKTKGELFRSSPFAIELLSSFE